jgi:hypothetical protein
MAVASLLTGLGLGVGLGSAYTLLSRYVSLGEQWTRWKATGRIMGYPLMAQVMQSIIGAEKDEVHGLSTKGMIDAIFDFVDRTVDFAWMISESIASQLFVQMIQQSIAYAIHTSHAGAVGTVCNVYSGSASIHGMQAETIGENIDLCDRATRGFLSSAVGLNTPSVAFLLTRGVNRRVEEVYSRIMTQINSLLDEWNDLALGYYRHYHTMARNRLQDALEMKESILKRAYGFLEQVANEHLSRINEQLDTLEGARAWYESNLISVDELKDIALRVNLEREASEENFDSYKDEILKSVEEALYDWDDKIQQALNDMKECEFRFYLLVDRIFGTLFDDVRDFVRTLCDEADKTIEDVCAYRNIRQAVKIEMVEELGKGEMSPEVEVYRLKWNKWVQIPNINVVYEYQSPRGLKWESADVEPKPVTPDVLRVQPLVEVDMPVVKYEYETVKGLRWGDP